MRVHSDCVFLGNFKHQNAMCMHACTNTHNIHACTYIYIGILIHTCNANKILSSQLLERCNSENRSCEIY